MGENKNSADCKLQKIEIIAKDVRNTTDINVFQ